MVNKCPEIRPKIPVIHPKIPVIPNPWNLCYLALNTWNMTKLPKISPEILEIWPEIPQIWPEIHETRLEIAEIPDTWPEFPQIRPKTLESFKFLEIPRNPAKNPWNF